MRVVITWNGSQDEFNRLVAAIVGNCTCELDEQRCPAHAMLANQEDLNRLHYVYTLRTRYLFEEFTTEQAGE